jgi:hypothetical protein
VYKHLPKLALGGGVALAYIAAMVLADTLGPIRRGTAEQVYRAIGTNEVLDGGRVSLAHAIRSRAELR